MVFIIRTVSRLAALTFGWAWAASSNMVTDARHARRPY